MGSNNQISKNNSFESLQGNMQDSEPYQKLKIALNTQ